MSNRDRAAGGYGRTRKVERRKAFGIDGISHSRGVEKVKAYSRIYAHYHNYFRNAELYILDNILQLAYVLQCLPCLGMRIEGVVGRDLTTV